MSETQGRRRPGRPLYVGLGFAVAGMVLVAVAQPKQADQPGQQSPAAAARETAGPKHWESIYENPVAVQAAARNANPQQGKRLYANRCEPCHDTDGGGDGPMHTMFIPFPANLTLIRNSPSMTKSIIMKGLSGTAMPPHNLAGGQVNDILAHLSVLPMDTEYEWDYPWELRGQPVPPGMGKTIYLTACQGCHGPAGQGDGPWAQNNNHVWPKPANFHARSSEIGRLYYVITNGLEGTMMAPQQPKFPQVARWALARYVAGLYGKGASAEVAAGNPSHDRNPFYRFDTAALAKGKVLFDLYCVGCHQGEANGSFLAPRLTDRTWRYGGGTDDAVWQIVTAGVPGKLMPGHEQFTEEERWQVITHVRYRGGLPDPLSNEEPLPERPRVVAQNLRFVPQYVVVKAGDTVTWFNNDQTPHTVTSDGWQETKGKAHQQPKEFNSGPLDPGASWSHTFNQPGAYMYHCMIHPYMRAQVEVVRPPRQR